MNEGWTQYHQVSGQEYVCPFCKGRMVTALVTKPAKSYNYDVHCMDCEASIPRYSLSAIESLGLAPYVEPEPEMPEVIFVQFTGQWFPNDLPEQPGIRFRYRRCVEMTPVLDSYGDLHCPVCKEYMVSVDHFCPRCRAEVKR